MAKPHKIQDSGMVHVRKVACFWKHSLWHSWVTLNTKLELRLVECSHLPVIQLGQDQAEEAKYKRTNQPHQAIPVCPKPTKFVKSENQILLEMEVKGAMVWLPDVLPQFLLSFPSSFIEFILHFAKQRIGFVYSGRRFFRQWILKELSEAWSRKATCESCRLLCNHFFRAIMFPNLHTKRLYPFALAQIFATLLLLNYQCRFNLFLWEESWVSFP